MLVLSTFCGLDLLGRGFQEHDFCVVQAGDIILGKDIREFKAIAGRFDGVIGGSPCQDFSRARRTPPTGQGLEMLGEFERVVMEAQPAWFLLENVPNVPYIDIDGYHIQRFYLNALECGSTQNRHRFFQFGSRDGFVLDIPRQPKPAHAQRCAMATEGTKTERRSWDEFCALQGIEPLSLPDLTQTARYKVVGNAVSLHVSRTIAAAIKAALDNPIYAKDVTLCACGCGRRITGRQKTATDACRKRLSVNRRIIKPVS
ncbi:MAG: DNA cytosine methyltransferase [Bacteroidetes bacterium]|nr:DNA cytosine methyltransferase [Bacteroidota bacterium]